METVPEEVQLSPHGEGPPTEAYGDRQVAARLRVARGAQSDIDFAMDGRRAPTAGRSRDPE